MVQDGPVISVATVGAANCAAVNPPGKIEDRLSVTDCDDAFTSTARRPALACARPWARRGQE